MSEHSERVRELLNSALEYRHVRPLGNNRRSPYIYLDRRFISVLCMVAEIYDTTVEELGAQLVAIGLVIKTGRTIEELIEEDEQTEAEQSQRLRDRIWNYLVTERPELIEKVQGL